MAFALSSFNGFVKAAYNLMMKPDPHVDHARPMMRAIGHHGFRIQDEMLRIPRRWGFFSPGPSRLQAMEGCLFASLLATIFAIVFIMGICASRGASYLFLLWYVTVIAVASVSTYIGARQYRAWDPPSWRWQVTKD